MPKISGIYQIQSGKKPERTYIGSSVNVGQRWLDHLSALKRGNHINKKLQNHYNKYGKSDLIFSLIVGCDKEDLIGMEQFYIDSKKSWFNISLKSGERRLAHSTEATRERIRLSKLGKAHSEERRKNQSTLSMGENNGFYGKKHTEEHKQKMREFMLAHPISKEVRERQRESLLKYYERRRMEKELETQKN